MHLYGHLSRPFAVTFSPDGRWLASGSFVPLLRIWEMASPEPSAWAAIAGEDARSVAINSLSFSADSRLLAISSVLGGKTLRIWDLSGAYMKEVPAPLPKAHQVLFARDGKTLLVADDRGALYQFAYRQHAFKLGRKFIPHHYHGKSEGISALASSAKGSQFATASKSGQLTIWQTETGKELAHWDFSGEIKALCFSENGRRLITGNDNGTLFLLSIPKEK